jgi:hypothetical protein
VESFPPDQFIPPALPEASNTNAENTNDDDDASNVTQARIHCQHTHKNGNTGTATAFITGHSANARPSTLADEQRRRPLCFFVFFPCRNIILLFVATRYTATLTGPHLARSVGYRCRHVRLLHHETWPTQEEAPYPKKS